MTATGGTTPYTWSATGLPTGLSINSSTGPIGGVVRAVGTWTVTVTAMDAASHSAGTQFSWAVKRECTRC
jgi:Putative Ig domain